MGERGPVLRQDRDDDDPFRWPETQRKPSEGRTHRNGQTSPNIPPASLLVCSPDSCG